MARIPHHRASHRSVGVQRVPVCSHLHPGLGETARSTHLLLLPTGLHAELRPHQRRRANHARADAAAVPGPAATLRRRRVLLRTGRGVSPVTSRTQPPRVVVVGSVNVDLVVRLSRLPGPGETATGGRFLQAPGGKGANQAAAAARLGADTTLIARVGDDPFGHDAIGDLAAAGVDTKHVSTTSGEATGVAVILVDATGENLIGVASGANLSLIHISEPTRRTPISYA